MPMPFQPPAGGFGAPPLSPGAPYQGGLGGGFELPMPHPGFSGPAPFERGVARPRLQPPVGAPGLPGAPVRPPNPYLVAIGRMLGY